LVQIRGQHLHHLTTRKRNSGGVPRTPQRGSPLDQPHHGEEEKKLPFFNVLVSRELEGRLRVLSLQEEDPTWTATCTLSPHHRSPQKMVVVNTLVLRAIAMYEPGNLQKEKKHLIRTLEGNEYTRETTERTFSRHLKEKGHSYSSG
jgi:hypothetical protein